MKQIDSIIQYLIDLDTKQIVKEIADLMIENPESIKCFPRVIGIAILAVEDAKENKGSSSVDSSYMQVYNEAKRLLDAKNNKGIRATQLTEYKISNYTIQYDSSIELINSISKDNEPWKDSKDVTNDNVLLLLFWRVLELEDQLLDIELNKEYDN